MNYRMFMPTNHNLLGCDKEDRQDLGNTSMESILEYCLDRHTAPQPSCTAEIYNGIEVNLIMLTSKRFGNNGC